MIKNNFKRNYIIGQGSFSRVYHATNTNNSDAVAIKVTEKTHKRFYLEESEVLRQVSGHRGFPKLIWSGKNDNELVIVMTLFSHSLHDKNLRRTISIPEILNIGKKITSALKFLHKLGYIHRDIKTENIVVNFTETSYSLIDFGLAKNYKIHGSHIPLMISSTFIGNLVFCSNNVLNINQASRRDDLISLALVLVYLIEGTLPWVNDTGSVEEMIKARSKVDMVKLLKMVPKELEIFMNHCLSLDFYQEPDYKLLKRLMSQGKLRILREIHKEHKEKKHKKKMIKIAISQISLPNDSNNCSTTRTSAPQLSETLRIKLSLKSKKI